MGYDSVRWVRMRMAGNGGEERQWSRVAGYASGVRLQVMQVVVQVALRRMAMAKSSSGCRS